MSHERGSLVSRLGEIRKRLVYCAIGAGIGFAVSYGFSEQLLRILALPLKNTLAEGEGLVYTGLPDMFFVYIKIAFVAGLLLSSPLIFYQFWMLVAPGLYRKKKGLIVAFMLSSSILFVGGGLFGYFVIFPAGFRFFLSFESDFLQALPSVRQYFSLSIKLLIGFGLVFELPVLIFFLSRMGVVSVPFLRKRRKYAVLLSFIVAAVLTPPDLVSQILLAIPLIILYEIGIITAKISGKSRAGQSLSGTE